MWGREVYLRRMGESAVRVGQPVLHRRSREPVPLSWVLLYRGYYYIVGTTMTWKPAGTISMPDTTTPMSAGSCLPMLSSVPTAACKATISLLTATTILLCLPTRVGIFHAGYMMLVDGLEILLVGFIEIYINLFIQLEIISKKIYICTIKIIQARKKY